MSREILMDHRTDERPDGRRETTHTHKDERDSEQAGRVDIGAISPYPTVLIVTTAK
jgi:hypothetical protein